MISLINYLYLVLNKKNLEGESLLSKDEYSANSAITKDYYKDLQNFTEQYQSNKQVSNYDSQMHLMMNDLSPNQVIDNQDLGLLFRLGEGYHEQHNDKIFQDTITIRHCNTIINVSISFSYKRVRLSNEFRTYSKIYGRKNLKHKN